MKIGFEMIGFMNRLRAAVAAFSFLLFLTATSQLSPKCQLPRLSWILHHDDGSDGAEIVDLNICADRMVYFDSQLSLRMLYDKGYRARTNWHASEMHIFCAPLTLYIGIFAIYPAVWGFAMAATTAGHSRLCGSDQKGCRTLADLN